MSDNNTILNLLAHAFYDRYQRGESSFTVAEIVETSKLEPRPVINAIKAAIWSADLLQNPQHSNKIDFPPYFFNSRLEPKADQPEANDAELKDSEKKQMLEVIAEKQARLDWSESQKGTPKSFTDTLSTSDMLSGLVAGVYSADEKRDYPQERNQAEKCGVKPAENHRPRTRPKNDPALVINNLTPVNITYNKIIYPFNFQNLLGQKNRGTGNRCGHNPEQPLAFKPMNPSGKGLPAPCFNAIKKLTQAYADIKKFMPLLNSAGYYQKAHAGKKGRKKEAERDKQRRLRKLKKCGAHVQMRSERRESIFIVLCVMLSKLDVKTMRVGTPLPNGKFMGFSMEQIAKRGGISLSRAERAMTDLVRVGYVKVFQRHDETLKKLGIYKGLAAVRTISVRLFGSLKLDEMLSASRKGASKLGFKLTQEMADLNALALQEQADFINERRYEDKGLPMHELRKLKAQLAA